MKEKQKNYIKFNIKQMMENYYQIDTKLEKINNDILNIQLMKKEVDDLNIPVKELKSLIKYNNEIPTNVPNIDNNNLNNVSKTISVNTILNTTKTKGKKNIERNKTPLPLRPLANQKEINVNKQDDKKHTAVTKSAIGTKPHKNKKQGNTRHKDVLKNEPMNTLPNMHEVKRKELNLKKERNQTNLNTNLNTISNIKSNQQHQQKKLNTQREKSIDIDLKHESQLKVHTKKKINTQREKSMDICLKTESKKIQNKIEGIKTQEFNNTKSDFKKIEKAKTPDKMPIKKRKANHEKASNTNENSIKNNNISTNSSSITSNINSVKKTLKSSTKQNTNTTSSKASNNKKSNLKNNENLIKDSKKIATSKPTSFRKSSANYNIDKNSSKGIQNIINNTNKQEEEKKQERGKSMDITPKKEKNRNNNQNKNKNVVDKNKSKDHNQNYINQEEHNPEIKSIILQNENSINNYNNKKIEMKNGLECLYLVLKSGFIDTNIKIKILIKNKKLFEKFNKKELIKELINFYEITGYTSDNYNLRKINKLFSPTEMSLNSLLFFDENDEQNLLNEVQHQNIIDIFKIIIILLNEYSNNIKDEDIFQYLFKEVYKKYKVNNIKNLFENTFNNKCIKFNDDQKLKIENILKYNNKILTASYMYYFNEHVSYFIYYLNELLNYINLKTEDGIYYYNIRKNLKENKFQQKIDSLNKYLI